MDIPPNAIEFKGKWYRSQSEVMWPVQFDDLKFKFDYEPGGDKTFPDFFFPALSMYGEAKAVKNRRPAPGPDGLPEWIRSHEHYGKWRQFHRSTGCLFLWICPETIRFTKYFRTERCGSAPSLHVSTIPRFK